MLNEDLVNTFPIPTEMPTQVGMITLRDGPKVIWAGKFPIRFNALNAAVKWQLLQFSIPEMQHVIITDTAGLISYAIQLNDVGSLGEMYIRELPNERLTALIITAPHPSRPLGWTLEENEIIKSQPDRKSSLKVMREFAAKQADERETITRWQEVIFSIFLQQLLNDMGVIKMS